MSGPIPVLCSAIALPETGEAPDWLHLLPAGVVRTNDGRGPYRADMKALMASTAPVRLPIDENHATDLAAPKGGESPARGWIVELQSRADGVWGRVEWTPEGRRRVEHREYRGISPVILHRRDGSITDILRASLTNVPNFVGLTALHHQEKTMDFRAWLIEALGLDADAGDDAIVAALKKVMEKPAPAVALQSALAPIAAIAGVAAGSDAAAVLAGVQRLKDGASDATTIVALQSELSGMAEKLNAMTDATSRTAAVAFVDGAIGLGRVGIKPMRDRYISMHMADAKGAEELINAMPAIKGGATLVGDPPKDDPNGLGEADALVIQLMGLDPVEYAKSLAAAGKEKI